MISGVVEKTIALRNPSRCKMRSKRSSKLTPHNSVNASGASAIMIGRIFSIAREINGGAASCQLSATARAARGTDDDTAILHFVDPIARFGNCRIMRCEEQRLAAFMHKVLQQLKRALGVCRVEIARGFVRQNDAWIVCQRT